MTCREPLHLDDLADQPIPDQILHQLYGLSETERRVFTALLESEDPTKVDDLADRVNRSRTTVYRALTRLVDSDLVVQRRQCFDDGGYCHRYRLPPIDRLAATFYRRVNERFRQLSGQVDSFAAGECLSVPDH